jgi:hypothetical protein
MRRARSRVLLSVIAASSLALAVLAIVLLVQPGPGQLIVTVAAPDNSVVDDARVLVDGQRRCTRAPCRLHNLSSGVHVVRVEAPGYRPSVDRAVEMRRGDYAVIEVILSPQRRTGGVRVPAVGVGLRLVVDGKDRGPLPVEVSDLSPGEHQLRIVGNDAYERFEQRITVSPGEVTTVAPKLRVLQGRARVELGYNADGAEVLLRCGEQEPVPLEPPATVSIAPEGGCELIAAKSGFQQFQQRLVFGQCDTQKTFMVDLRPAAGIDESSPDSADASEGKKAPARGRRAARARRVAQARARQAASAAQTAAVAPAASGRARGMINISSIPVALVLVDGRPIGTSPKRVRTTTGTHNVVFIHPKGHRKAVRVKVKPGGAAVAAVRFNDG